MLINAPSVPQMMIKTYLKKIHCQTICIGSYSTVTVKQFVLGFLASFNITRLIGCVFDLHVNYVIITPWHLFLQFSSFQK